MKPSEKRKIREFIGKERQIIMDELLSMGDFTLWNEKDDLKALEIGERLNKITAAQVNIFKVTGDVRFKYIRNCGPMTYMQYSSLKHIGASDMEIIELFEGMTKWRLEKWKMQYKIKDEWFEEEMQHAN